MDLVQDPGFFLIIGLNPGLDLGVGLGYGLSITLGVGICLYLGVTEDENNKKNKFKF